jgi:hypothetical protein
MDLAIILQAAHTIPVCGMVVFTYTTAPAWRIVWTAMASLEETSRAWAESPIVMRMPLT